MARRSIPSGLMALALAAGAAFAADKAPDKAQAVQLAPVALPVVVNGRLINYVFVTVKLNLAPTADGAAVRARFSFTVTNT